MPSLVPGYSYDIFISYRHKDNRTVGDREATGWVTDFVAYLRREIQSTIKEDVSIYFDENPYDGIQATHDVNDSLKGKLRCLLFIPVLSQTYCDPKSFAWQHEFLVFKEGATKDSLGLKIPLKNGNVSSRILPVCIHDLDAKDRAVLEVEIGPVRAVDFIFRSPGVSRPLTPSDKREDNSSRTLYKDQINKVALAVKDALGSMANPAAHEPSITVSQAVPAIAKHNGRRSLWVVSAILAFLLIGLALYRWSGTTTSQVIDKSIAILPFVDMSQAHDLEYLGDGISEEIITALTAINDLRIVGRTSSFQFKGEKLDLREVGERLNVAVVLEGSVQQSGDKLRITAQLIRTDDNSHIWSARYDVQQTDIFKIQDNIAAHIVEKLNLTLTTQVENRLIKKETVPEAYTLFLKGLFQYKRENYDEALKFFENVEALDSLYAPAYAYQALCKAWIIIGGKQRTNTIMIREATQLSERSIKLNPFLPEGYSGRALIAWAIQRDYRKARTYFEKSIELNPSSSLIKNRYAYFLTWMGEFSKASRLAQEAMQSDPVDYNCYVNLFNSSLYDGKLSQAALYSRELKRITDSHHAFISRDIALNFYGNSLERVVFLCDSLVKTKNELSSNDLAYHAMATFGLQQTKLSDEILQQLSVLRMQKRDGSYFSTACVYAYRQQYDSCMANLYQSFKNQEARFNLLKIEPLFKAFHSRPAFAKLYAEAGFDQY